MIGEEKDQTSEPTTTVTLAMAAAKLRDAAAFTEVEVVVPGRVVVERRRVATGPEV